MTHLRWTTVDGLLEAALERAPAERAAFLREACAGNETLHREVESLLAHAETRSRFPESPALAGGRVDGSDRERAFVGRQLGSHRILGLLGTGGMGEVYRAHDTKLGREVAIKILPRIFSTDPERRARFDREARLLAALNHPHIGAIYGVEESDGVRALVLELVEGETLADRLARGSVPLAETLPIARQIAEALEAAHEKGIVHRDLKPGNIKITPEGIVKVLDFGLAKATTGDASGPDLSQSPTMTIGGTREGVILGTAAYMSPEQARGKPVDKRTDIWAFGCVLYEMLTGRVAFAGDTVSDTIVAILEREPEWSALPAPGPVRRLLQRCLEKDPRRRLHDIADARVEIDDVLSGRSLAVTDSAVVDPAHRADHRWRSMATVVLLVALVAVGALLWGASLSAPAPLLMTRFTIGHSGTAAISVNGNDRSVAITPDGRRVVYAGNDGTELFVRSLDSLDATPIATGTGLRAVFVAPDGQWVGFVEGLTTLKKVAITGGPAVTLAEVDGSSRGATWTRDNTIIFGTNAITTGLQRVSAAGGAVTVLTRPNRERGEGDHLWPEVLPDGGAILFTLTATAGGLDAAQVAVLDIATGMSKVLVRGASHAHYAPSGHLLYTARGALHAVPFDLSLLETRGTPVTLLPRLSTTVWGASDFGLASDGTIAYVDAPDPTAPRTLVWVDRQGRETPLGAPPRAYTVPRLSPDGARVVVSITDREEDIWVWDLARQTLTRVVSDPAADRRAMWTPDGRSLLFISLRNGPFNLYRHTADGTGSTERLTESGNQQVLSDVSPDGAWLVFSEAVPMMGRDLMMLALDGSRRVQPLLQTAFEERNGMVSPNGGWLAYESDSSGRFEVYVRPFPNTSAGQWPISTSGGTRPVWAPSGLELFFVAPDGSIMTVSVAARGPAWSAGNPAKLIEGRYYNGVVSGPQAAFDVARDGRFLMIKEAGGGPIPPPAIVVVQNWIEELNRLVPVN